jgi:superfamily II DNA or RNA helicase
MKILAKHGITVPKEHITDDIYKQIKNDLIVFNPAYLSCVEYGKRPVQKTPAGRYIRIPELLTFMKEYKDRLELPRGYIHRLSEIFDQEIELEYSYCENIRHLIDNKLNVDLYNYQYNGVSGLLQKQCGILSSPAASGKTVVGVNIVSKLGLKTLWLVHLDKLMKQALGALLKFTDCDESDIGVISEGKYKVGNVFTSAVVDTARKHSSQLSKENFGLVIVDECHRAPTKKIYDVLMKLSPQYLYGLSATPYRADGLDSIMKYMLGPITEIKREEVIKVNKIVTPEVVIVRTDLSIKTELFSSYPDFMLSLVNNNKRNNMILYEVIKEIMNDNMCLVLSDRVEHCHTLYNKLLPIFPFIGIVHGKIKKSETDKLIKISIFSRRC